MRSIPAHVSRKHPLATGSYAIYTPAIAAFVEVMGDWLDSRITGAYVYGASRFGKTKAIKYFLRQLLEERFGGPVPLNVWQRPFAFKSPSEFYGSILVALQYPVSQARQSAVRRLSLLAERLIASADSCASSEVFLIVDEAQGLTTQEWLWLLALQNNLDADGYSLCVFSIASHQLAYQFDLLSRTGNPHVAARFLVDQWRFPGVEGQDELAFILDGYDEDSEWPSGSGCSYLHHFAPQHFESGRRLADSAESLWKSLEALLPEDYRSPVSFPMKHIALAVEDTMFKIAGGADWDEVTSEAAWIKALGKQRLSDHLRAISIEF